MEWYSFFGKYGDRDPVPYYEGSLKTRYNYNKIHIGHMTPRFEAKTNTSKCYKMTLLREPVDRVMSAFYYHKHRTEEWPSCFQLRCRLWHEYINDVVRRFASFGTAWNSYQTKKYLSGDDKEKGVKPEALEAAKATVADFDFVCFLDSLPDCIRDIAKALNVPNFEIEDHFVNKNRKRLPVDAKTQQQISEANYMDVALYNWARQRFGRNAAGTGGEKG